MNKKDAEIWFKIGKNSESDSFELAWGMLHLLSEYRKDTKPADPALCPQCGNPYTSMARDCYGTKTCINKHHWYTCRVHKTVVEGKPPRNTPFGTCTCENFTERNND